MGYSLNAEQFGFNMGLKMCNMVWLMEVKW